MARIGRPKSYEHDWAKIASILDPVRDRFDVAMPNLATEANVCKGSRWLNIEDDDDRKCLESTG
jgi:hypothetical protein